jgi:lysozyme
MPIAAILALLAVLLLIGRSSVMSGSLQTSETGKANIIRWEGFKRQAYRDTGGRWSIGIGHLLVPTDGILPRSAYVWNTNLQRWDILDIDAVMALNFTDGQVWQLFDRDRAVAESVVTRYVSVALTQGQFDALVDFAFNLGEGQFSASTLRRKLNGGDYNGAFAEFDRWVYDDGVKLTQLAERRDAAQLLWMA